jgi:ATP-binding cassette subfamily B protein
VANRKKTRIRSFSNNLFLLGMIWKISRTRVLLSFLKSLLGFSCWVFFTVIFMRFLFGAAELKRGFPEVAVFTMGTLAFMLLITLFDSWFTYRFVPITDQRLHYSLNRQLFEKATSVDISCYENPEFYNSYAKATMEIGIRALSVLENIPKPLSALFASVYVVYTIFTINVATGFLALFPFVGNFFFGKLAERLQYARNQDDIPFKRRQDYVNRAVYLQKYSKEVRTSNVFSVLLAIYGKAYAGIFRDVDRYSRKIFGLELSRELICFPLVFEGVWLCAAYCAMVLHSVGIGDFVVLSSAIVSTTWMLVNLSQSIVASYSNGLYINNLVEFLSYKSVIDENQTGPAPQNDVDTLEFRNVSFTYGAEAAPVLKNINMLLKRGQKIALVGHNGAGKFTLIKLIMRLYDPTAGEILLNGRNIKDYDIKKYRSLIATTFQDFQVFSLSVVENVTMSSVMDPAQRERAIAALKQCNVYDTVAALPGREDAILTREFDDNGVVLSGGRVCSATGSLASTAPARSTSRASMPAVFMDSSTLRRQATRHQHDACQEQCPRGAQKREGCGRWHVRAVHQEKDKNGQHLRYGVLQGNDDCRPTARQRVLSRRDAVHVARHGESDRREEDRDLPGIEGPGSETGQPRGDEAESQVAEVVPHPSPRRVERGRGLRARDVDAGGRGLCRHCVVGVDRGDHPGAGGQPSRGLRAPECDHEEHSHEHPGPYEESRILHRNGVHVDRETGEPEQGDGENDEAYSRYLLQRQAFLLDQDGTEGENYEADGHEAGNDSRADEADRQSIQGSAQDELEHETRDPHRVLK